MEEEKEEKDDAAETEAEERGNKRDEEAEELKNESKEDEAGVNDRGKTGEEEPMIVVAAGVKSDVIAEFGVRVTCAIQLVTSTKVLAES